MSAELGIVEKLLVAALEIEESGKTTFSAEDLVVSAWQKFPEAFGLKGHIDDHGKPIYPDSNRVYAEIMGSKPLRKQGLLKKVGKKQYTLTEAGRNRALVVSGQTDNSLSRKWALSREDQVALRRIFDSRAVRKDLDGNKDDISFFDACGFWGIGPRSNAKDLWNKFSNIEGILERSMEALGSREAASSQHGGTQYSKDELKRIQHIHNFLQDKFASDLEIIKGRTDERK